MKSLRFQDKSRQIFCWLPKDTLVYSDTFSLKLIAEKSNEQIAESEKYIGIS